MRNKEKFEFVAALTKLLPKARSHVIAGLAMRLARLSATHARLAEAQCNGDWPADNGSGATFDCAECGSAWRGGGKRVALLGGGSAVVCRSCRVEAQITKALAEHGLKPIFGGDPRGCTVKIETSAEESNDFAREGICVPQQPSPTASAGRKD